MVYPEWQWQFGKELTSRYSTEYCLKIIYDCTLILNRHIWSNLMVLRESGPSGGLTLVLHGIQILFGVISQSEETSEFAFKILGLKSGIIFKWLPSQGLDTYCCVYIYIHIYSNIYCYLTLDQQ